MTTAPTWSPVDDDTNDLLSLVANDQLHPRPAEEWEVYVGALNRAADASGRIDPNTLRALVRGEIAPRRIGAFTNRAKAEGLIADTGEWQVSDDTEGRNGGKPCRVYRLTNFPAALTTPQHGREQTSSGGGQPHPGKGG